MGIMASKILVADDSPTIQKVVTITLSSTAYEMEECLNEEDLFKKLKSTRYDLVLMDFGLSDKKTGEELAKEVHAMAPTTPIMVMLGSLDNMDESSWNEAGIRDSIIKPFESASFIQKCQNLLEDANQEDFPDMIELEQGADETQEVLELADEIESTDQWNIDAPAPTEQGDTQVVSLSEQEEGNALNQEVAGWGMEAPEPLPDLQVSLPPKIGAFVSEEERGLLPPPIDKEEGLEELSGPREQEEDSELISEIHEEFDSGDFWSADGSTTPEVAVSLEEEAVEQPDELEEPPVQNETELVMEQPDELEGPSIQEEPSIQRELGSAPSVASGDNADEIVQQVTNALTPVIEGLVKEYCSKKVEQVAWEVIPDLAENLIRTEIKELSQKVQENPS